MLRPRVSTSAGQSVGGEAATVPVLDGVADAVVAGAFMDLARAEKAVLLEQVRQLPSGCQLLQRLVSWAGSNIRLAVGPEDDAWRQRFRGLCRNGGGMAVCLRLVALRFLGHVRCSGLVALRSVVLLKALGWNEQASCSRRRHLLGLHEPPRCIVRCRVVGFVSLCYLPRGAFTRPGSLEMGVES